MGIRRTMRFVQTAWLLAVSAALPGCYQNQCTANQSRCSSSTEWESCQLFGGYDTFLSTGTVLQWGPPASCGPGFFCVQGDAGIACSASSTPVEQCAMGGYACWQDTVTQCVEGYPTYPSNSPSECLVDAGATCVVTSDRTCGYCLPADAAPVADPTCDASVSTCVGNAVYSCACGFRLSELTDCGDAGVCFVSDGGGACIEARPFW